MPNVKVLIVEKDGVDLDDAEEYSLGEPGISPYALFDDFDNRLAWSPSTSGTNAAASVSGGNATMASGKHLGVAEIRLGTVLASHACLQPSGNLVHAVVFGDGAAEYEALIYIPTLATATDDYVLRIGMGDTANADHVDGIYFEYARASSVNWRVKTANNSSRTVVTSSVAVTAGAWHKLRFKVNSAGTSVEFFVNGTSVGTITTNIPTTVGRGCYPNQHIITTAVVTGGRNCFIDWINFYKEFTARD